MPDERAIQGWVEEARAGSAEAFDGLARHFLPRLRRWALVRTGDPDEAEDVVQGTLVRAWSRIGSLGAPAAFSVWLYRITQTVAGDRVRRARSRLRTLERFRHAPGRERTQPPAEADCGELAELVRSFMEELSARQRAMMDLVDLQGMAPSEAAAMLGINENTARVHLLRARRRVRAQIVERRPDVVEDLR